MTIDENKRLWREAFGDPEGFIEGFFQKGFSRSRCRCVYEDGHLAAALYWFDCRWKEKKLAYIYGVATAKALRGRGLCRDLMEDTHRHLQTLGYDGAVLVPAGEGLFAMYEKMGYRGFSPMETREVFPHGLCATEQISPERYAALRQCRLPENGIVQQGDTLCFLATYAGFYTAGDALFCAAREGNTLYFQEFFGQTETLPGITAALGGGKGVVRLPGGGKPFAMYRSFTEDKAMPGYFGIALD